VSELSPRVAVRGPWCGRRCPQGGIVVPSVPGLSPRVEGASLGGSGVPREALGGPQHLRTVPRVADGGPWGVRSVTRGAQLSPRVTGGVPRVA